MSFKSRIKAAAEKKDCKIVLALDLPPERTERLLQKAQEVLRAVKDQICAVKLNRHLILPLGIYQGVQELLKQAKDYGLPTIMDCKINDIGNTNRTIAQHYFESGFDALTANPFVGWEDGLQPVFEAARQMNRGVILLVYMSHKAAWEGYGQEISSGESLIPQYTAFASKAIEWKADGAVVGATYPDKIADVYSVLGDKIPIYSPGIGAQGGNIKEAIQSGTEYPIVGRAITMAKDPWKAAKELRLAVNACNKTNV